MTIRQRGNTYLVDVKVGAKECPTGEAVRVRVAAPDKKEAKKLEARIRNCILSYGAWDPKVDATAKAADKAGKKAVVGTLTDALEEAWSYPSGRRQGWKFQRSGTIQYKRAKECVDLVGADRLCATIKPADFEFLTRHFLNAHQSNDTINTKLQCFFRILWHAERKGWIIRRPMLDRLAPGAPREFIYTPEMEKAVVDYFTDIMRDRVMAELFQLGIETGLRLNELLKSVASQWDVNEKVIYVPSLVAKSKVSRYVTLTDKAISIMRPLLKDKPADYRPFGISQSAAEQRFAKARTFVGQEKNFEFCFHATRHTRATRLARQTRDPFVVMSQLGHGNIAMSMRYIKMAAMDLTPAPNVVMLRALAS